MVSTINFEFIDSGSNPDTVANKKEAIPYAGTAPWLRNAFLNSSISDGSTTGSLSMLSVGMTS